MKAKSIYASAVKLAQGGVLLLGPSGSGKSSLAVHLIDHYGGQLIADDRVCLTVTDTRLHAAPPDNLAGLLELRGLGIITMPHQNAVIDLAVELVARKQVPRLAKADSFTITALTYRLSACMAMIWPAPRLLRARYRLCRNPAFHRTAFIAKEMTPS